MHRTGVPRRFSNFAWAIALYCTDVRGSLVFIHVASMHLVCPIHQKYSLRPLIERNVSCRYIQPHTIPSLHYFLS